MKINHSLSVILLLIIPIGLFAQSQQTIKIKGTIVYQNAFCGGKQPSADILKQYEQLFNFSNSTFRIVNNADTSKVYTIETNKNGKFTVKITEGTYTYFMTTKFDKTLKINFKPDCNKWLNKSFGIIEIKAKQKCRYELKYTFGCNPCEPPRS